MPSAQILPSSTEVSEELTLPIKSKKVGAPRLDPYDRLLNRLFEPLHLLKIIGQTRERHTSEPRGTNESETNRRSFLQALAYLCDFQKGGPSCTSIGVEDAQSQYIFWVASNDDTCGERIASFLYKVLRLLQGIDAAASIGDDAEPIKRTLVRFCILFANRRVTAEAGNLRKAIVQCNAHLEKKGMDPTHEVLQALQNLHLHVNDNIHLCCAAWRAAQSNSMVVLSAEARREERLRGPNDMPGPFSRAQHSIGRLAYRVHACKQLFRHAGSVSPLLDQFEVRLIPRAEGVSPPLHDGHTSLRGILNRMLRPDDPKRQEIEENLIKMDRDSGIFRQFMKNLTRCEPVVHAEIQCLEHFSKGRLNFAYNDRFIAISKPACLCCKLYFQHHPARMVIPQSHEKVWPNWSPPRLETFTKGDVDSDVQRDVLNKITEALRNDVVAQVLRCSQPAAWHADSVTGLTALGTSR
ncbi:hypothetical protein CC79DRAFT_1311078 [Sarocladium strictum]